MNKNKKIFELSPEDRELWLECVKGISRKTVVNRVKSEVENIKSVFVEKMDNYILKKRIDLHGYTINEAYEAVLTFIELNFKAGRREISIITGKGKFFIYQHIMW